MSHWRAPQKRPDENLSVWFLENFIGPFLKWSLFLYGSIMLILVFVVAR